MSADVTRLEPSPSVHESAPRIVWALAWPAVLLNSLQVVNTLLDRGFIGHLESAALTAHGGATNVMFLLFSLAMAVGTSATALVSRAYGAQQNQELRQASREALGVAAFGGVLLAGIAALIAPLFARALLPADDHRSATLMVQFLWAYVSGMPAIFLIQVLAGSLRGVGDTKSPMVISGFQILLHIVLNYVLIFPSHDIAGLKLPGLGLGLLGAGLALSISAWVSAIVYLAFSARSRVGTLWPIRLPRLDWTRRILKIALPAALMSVLRVGSLALFTVVLASIPMAVPELGQLASNAALAAIPGFPGLPGSASAASTAIAAMSVGFAIESIMFMPAFGLSVAAATLVGQSLGMQRPDRAERMGWTAAHHSAIVTGILAIPIYFAAPTIAGVLVGGKADIAAEAALLIQLLCLTEVFFGYAMTLIGAMQGAGDTVRPMWITIFTMWGLRVPLAFVLTLPLGMGATGAWVSMSVTQAVQGLAAIWLFKQGGWKTKKV
ncbi:MAG TPA: MATE family efflux transporter [Fimbriimonadaceae bacterium]|nr:MATE family efflux transporter [Fimbriimonadaceae bacterium]